MSIQIIKADALELLKGVTDNSIDLVATDPPYFRVKKDKWDNQWPNEAAFLAWLNAIVKEYARVLKPTGSLYLFASHSMASKIEAMISEHFAVKNHIVWYKVKGLHQKVCKARQRAYFPATERIIFAVGKESNKAKIDRAYAEACAPIIDHFRRALKSKGLSQADVNKRLGNHMAGHLFGKSQWRLPSRDKYKKLQAILKPHLTASYDDLLKQRDELLSEHFHPETRPFNVDGTDLNTDIWIESPVQYYEGKHPCEKPQRIMQHIIKASSKPNDIVLDSFVGGGSTALACAVLDRQFIGSEIDEKYHEAATARVEKYFSQDKRAFSP